MTRYAWHFLRSDWKAHDGFLVKVGKTYEHVGRLEPCVSGFHASTRAFDALKYAYRDPVVTFVRCEGDIMEHGDPVDKFVCRQRTALWGYDCTEELWTFARICALEVLPLWPEAPQVVRDFLETGDESIRAAARDAASYAASYAARYAARDAARDAARAAARDAARDAARAAFIDKANHMLESLLFDGAVSRGLVTS